jgi:hypothetical protein
MFKKYKFDFLSILLIITGFFPFIFFDFTFFISILGGVYLIFVGMLAIYVGNLKETYLRDDLGVLWAGVFFIIMGAYFLFKNIYELIFE